MRASSCAPRPSPRPRACPCGASSTAPAVRLLLLLLLLLCCCVSHAAAGEAPPDQGYLELFVTHNVSTPRTCSPVPDLPAHLDGTFLIPTLGQFEMGGEAFQGLLDGFGKLLRFRLGGGQLCFTARMMDTVFYNDSVAAGKIAPSMLFMETAPPRGYNGIENLRGGNDNVYVNTYQVGGHYRSVTDSQLVLEFDPVTLHMERKLKWDDKLETGISLGSAHQLPAVGGDGAVVAAGCVVDVMPQVGFLQLEHSVTVFQICPDAPNTRVALNSFKYKYMPYFHSWGLTATHVVLPLMHFTVDMIDVIEGKTLSEAFVPEDADRDTTVLALVPLDGNSSSSAADLRFTVPGALYYTHTLNTYDRLDASAGHAEIVMDVIAWPAGNPFADDSASLGLYRNKTARDHMQNRGVPTRLVLDTVSGTATQTTLPGFEDGGAMGRTATDFTSINPLFSGREYCFFYGVQWYYHGHASPSDDSYATMAIIKHDVCTGKSTFWSGNAPGAAYHHFYPSEPKFVPRPGAADEDDGTLVFTALDGATRKSSLIVADAKTMQTVSNATLPTTVGFTTHGEFYPAA